MIFWQRVRPAHIPVTARRCVSTSTLERRLAEPVQAYISTSRDPYVNLSIEHYFLQKSAAESALLFLYVNRPSIIIGRNQNPWLEVNLALLNQARGRPETEPPALGAVDLVRRRSGGGTVFHDEGNVNWTIICPSADFTRDKHAEMIVRALRSCGVERSRVNERHDIVLDQGDKNRGDFDPDDTHTTPFTNVGNDGPRPLKVSGSAYKLTRGRALHHGTCLLSSPNLNVIPDYLHSPAKPYIKARGVESVSSPVSNILLGNEQFMTAVQSAFANQYGVKNKLSPESVGEDWLEIESIRKGCDELQSLEWKYLQTPQFTISNASDPESRVGLELTVRYGAITGASVTHIGEHIDLRNELSGVKLHEVDSWELVLGSSVRPFKGGDSKHLLGWLQRMLPRTGKE